MLNLIQNENMKIYRRWRTWIMVVLMIGAVVLGSFMEWYYDKKETTEGSWQEHMLQERPEQLAMLNDPDTHEETKAYLREQIAIQDYQLANNIRPEQGTMWDGINTSAELVILITLFTVIVAGDSLAGEFTSGTIKLLLIRPASRLRILLAKYISVLGFGLLLLIVLFIVSIIANGLFYQFKHIDLPLVTVDGDGQVIVRNMMANLWQSYLLYGVSTIMFVTMAFMISSAFRSSAMAIGFSIFALFAGSILSEVVQRYAWGKYLLFANIDLARYLADRPYQEGMTMTFSIAVLAGYFILFNVVAWLVFTRRDVAA